MPDPIFAANENHKKLDKSFLEQCRAEEAGCVKRSDVDRAGEAEETAARKMARTKPTTAAGASAMLTYITTRPLTGLFELGETDWHETAFRTVAASLVKITGQS